MVEILVHHFQKLAGLRQCFPDRIPAIFMHVGGLGGEHRFAERRIRGGLANGPL